MARPAVPSRPPVPAPKLPAKVPAKAPPPKKTAAKGAVAGKAKSKATAKKKQRGSGSEALGLIVLSGTVLFLSVAALPVCVLLVVGMLPTIVAYIVDQTPRRTLTLTVGPLNLAGTAPYCLQLWYGVVTMRSLGGFLGNVWVWLVMYLAAALGWLFFLGMPVIVHFMLERSIDRRKARLQQIQKKLRADWGDEVDAAGSGVPTPDT